MVWRVCRQALRRPQDAEDAFQATFLLLIKHARSIRSSESAAGWLYRVAYRTSLRARKNLAARREESLAVDPLAPSEEAFPDLLTRQTSGVLVEELMRLPAKYQTPLVLRYLEGQSRRAIADQTDTTIATVQGRLARGKQLLRRRLLQRGVSLSAAMATLGLAGRNSQAAEIAPAHVLAQTTSNSVAVATGGSLAASAAVVSLYQQGVRAMLLIGLAKPAGVAATVAAVALLAMAPGAAGDKPKTAFSDAPVLLAEVSEVPAGKTINAFVQLEKAAERYAESYYVDELLKVMRTKQPDAGDEELLARLSDRVRTQALVEQDEANPFLENRSLVVSGTSETQGRVRALLDGMLAAGNSGRSPQPPGDKAQEDLPTDSLLTLPTPEVRDETTLAQFLEGPISETPTASRRRKSSEESPEETPPTPVGGSPTVRNDSVPNVDAVFFQGQSLSGMEYGDMGRNGRKLTDAEQSDFLRKLWAKRAAADPPPADGRASIKELHVWHTYWEHRYDAMKRRLEAMSAAESARAQPAEVGLAASEIWKARAEMLRYERELKTRALETSPTSKKVLRSPTVTAGRGDTGVATITVSGREVTAAGEVTATATPQSDGSAKLNLEVAPGDGGRSPQAEALINVESLNARGFAPQRPQPPTDGSGETQRVLAALQQPLPPGGFDFPDGTPLEEVLDFIGNTYDLDTYLDRRALDDLGLGPGQQVGISRHHGTVSEALRQLLEPLELVAIADNGVLTVTTEEKAAKTLDVRVYSVEDLLKAGPARAKELTTTILAMVEPTSWANNGEGTAELTLISGGILTVSQSQRGHERLVELLALLREANTTGGGGRSRQAEPPENPAKNVEALNAGGSAPLRPQPPAVPTRPAAATPLLPPDGGREGKYGSRNRSYGYSVKQLQGRLNERIAPSPWLDEDGDFGPKTVEAVRAFQKQQGLRPTGFADAATRSALGFVNPVPAVDQASRRREWSEDLLVDPPPTPVGGSPTVVETVPQRGAKEVDPGLKEVRVTFDRDMDPGGYSFTGNAQSGMPEVPKDAKPKWIDKRTCALPVKLEPGREYRVGINAPSYKNFKSADGTPAAIDELRFTTGSPPSQESPDTELKQGKWRLKRRPSVLDPAGWSVIAELRDGEHAPILMPGDSPSTTFLQRVGAGSNDWGVRVVDPGNWGDGETYAAGKWAEGERVRVRGILICVNTLSYNPSTDVALVLIHGEQGRSPEEIAESLPNHRMARRLLNEAPVGPSLSNTLD